MSPVKRFKKALKLKIPKQLSGAKSRSSKLTIKILRWMLRLRNYNFYPLTQCDTPTSFRFPRNNFDVR